MLRYDRSGRIIKILMITLSSLAVLLSIILAAVQLFDFSVGRPIYRYSAHVDLRNEDISLGEYQHLRQALPDCSVRWMIPIGQESYDSFSQEIVISDLDINDVPMFGYFADLRRVKATDARCYDALAALEAFLPECTVEWGIHFGNKIYFPSLETIDLTGSGVAPEELKEKLSYFPSLKEVRITDVQLDAQYQDDLLLAYPDIRFLWNVDVCGKTWISSSTELSYEGEQVDVQALAQAANKLPDVSSINLRGTGCTVEELLIIRQAYDAEIQSEITLFRITFSTQVTELDFSNIPMEDTRAVEQILPLMPNLERVVMCDCGISSEEMDALWKRNPHVRFVWTVKIGRISLRTDVTSFIGAKHGYIPNLTIVNPYEDPLNRLFDKDCVEFKYCVDMVCLDLGHMGITDYSFVQYMPKLKYLILAETHGSDFSYVKDLTELVYLEIFLTDFSDTEVLMNLRNLKDLNIAHTRVSDITYLKQMTWLERLWISYTGVTLDQYEELCQALPNTQIDITAKGSTENGWRKGKYYYEMRDYLGMYYLN